MRNCTQRASVRQMTFLRNQFAQRDGLPFSDVLSAAMVTQALQAAGVEENERIYTSTIIFWMFLSQVISADPACRAAVARLIAHRVSNSEEPCSAETGAYCQARARMPEQVFAECVRQTGRGLDTQSPDGWRWLKRDVKIADGTTCSMPDTPANQAAYPQPESQKPGLGFPLLRLLAVFSLATGVVLDMRFCRFAGKHQSELGMLRELWHMFNDGDIVLSDCYLCSWFEIAMLQRRNVDVVMHMHQARTVDFRRGERLGPGDHVVEWPKPKQRPDWMDQATYDALPDKLVMREVRIHITQRGCRSEEITLATTLLDADTYSRDELGVLYRARWHAELDLRALKDTMQMDVLRGKTPDIVRKEIWTHALAYNLIRTVMAQAAQQHNLLPRTISFTGALQTLQAFQPKLTTAAAAELPRLLAALWQAIATHRVGDRPGRVEPRAKKRRPKPYKLLTTPRREARIALCSKT